MMLAYFTNTETGKTEKSVVDSQEFFEKTFSPAVVYRAEGLLVRGKTYEERKAFLESLAIGCQQIWGESADLDLTYSEWVYLCEFFERNGRRYGLLREFRENGIC